MMIGCRLCGLDLPATSGPAYGMVLECGHRFHHQCLRNYATKDLSSTETADVTVYVDQRSIPGHQLTPKKFTFTCPTRCCGAHYNLLHFGLQGQATFRCPHCPSTTIEIDVNNHMTSTAKCTTCDKDFTLGSSNLVSVNASLFMRRVVATLEFENGYVECFSNAPQFMQSYGTYLGLPRFGEDARLHIQDLVDEIRTVERDFGLVKMIALRCTCQSPTCSGILITRTSRQANHVAAISPITFSQTISAISSSPSPYLTHI